jgi:hypothetical protein
MKINIEVNGIVIMETKMNTNNVEINSSESEKSQRPSQLAKSMEELESNLIQEKTKSTEEAEDVRYVFYVKILGVVIITILCIPFLISNIYYIRVENSCSIIKPNSLKISLKEYLVVATIVDGITYLGVIISMLMLNPNIQNETYKILYCLLTPFRVFSIIWDILGAIVFWGYVVNKNECSNGLSEYLYTIFILKIVFALMEFKNKKNANNE